MNHTQPKKWFKSVYKSKDFFNIFLVSAKLIAAISNTKKKKKKKRKEAKTHWQKIFLTLFVLGTICFNTIVEELYY